MAKPLRQVFTLSAAVLLISAFAGANATAATQLGDTCVANQGVPGTVVQSALAPGSTTYTAPANGVITSWGIGFPGVGGYIGKLLLLHAAGVPDAYNVAFVSDPVTLIGGLNTTPAGIAIKAGDIIAMTGSPSGTACATANAADVVKSNAAATNPSVGSTVAATGPIAGAHATIFANVEADADNDGFGDESQDKCPRKATIQQVACPDVKVAKRLLPPSNKFVELLISSSSSASVTVAGSVSIKASSAKKSSAASTFNVGPVTKTVNLGEIASFKLSLPKKLVAALKAFPKSKKFKLKLTITGNGLANTDTSTSTVTLRGTKK